MRPRRRLGLLALAFGITEVRAAEPSVLGEVSLDAGLRTWHSAGQVRYGFRNGGPRAGNPSSSLDWTGLDAEGGELTIGLRHRPTGAFVAATGGLGQIGRGGTFQDRDFYAGQVSFSATRSEVAGAALSYGIVDLGTAFAPFPAFAAFEVAPFVGYHRWDENPSASGVLCAASDLPRSDCAASSTGRLEDTSVKALSYDIRWDALRVGLGARVPLFAGLSLRGSAAWVPYARYATDDSHYLRQSSDPALGLGPVPNVFIRGAGHGVETELFLDYAIGAGFTIGLGGRYWDLASDDGSVRNRLSAATKPVTTFETERYGLLLEASYRF